MRPTTSDVIPVDVEAATACCTPPRRTFLTTGMSDLPGCVGVGGGAVCPALLGASVGLGVEEEVVVEGEGLGEHAAPAWPGPRS